MKPKPIYKLYDTLTETWQSCNCDKVCYGATMKCLHATLTGKDMEAHIRKEHPEMITAMWREV